MLCLLETVWELRGFLFQAEDGIRDLVRSRGLGDVYKRQLEDRTDPPTHHAAKGWFKRGSQIPKPHVLRKHQACLLYTSDAADERSSVDLGGRRIIKKKKQVILGGPQ